MTGNALTRGSESVTPCANNTAGAEPQLNAEEESGASLWRMSDIGTDTYFSLFPTETLS